MKTRINEAAKTIADFHDCPCDGECDACIGEARALDADGHLMPDLPEPDDADGGQWDAEEGVKVFDMSKAPLPWTGEYMPGWVTLFLAFDGDVKMKVMPAESMRRIGLCLIAAADASSAAADYAEEHANDQ
ncbi:MAG: hypothetical protein ACI38U_03295 [Corynebacterium sp.]|uniref:hypothetical protein n=1 Tax=Corynebacterium sp. TaxID=1720 RepID=UPI003F128D51